MSQLITMGSYIALHLPKDEPAVTPGLLRYDGTLMKISKIVYMKKANGHTTGVKYFELEGCISMDGIPYSIDPDWCRKV